MGIQSTNGQTLTVLSWDTLQQKTTGRIIRSADASSITTYFLSKLWKSDVDHEKDVKQALDLKRIEVDMDNQFPSKICETVRQFFSKFNDEHYEYYHFFNGEEKIERVRNVRCVDNSTKKEVKIEWDVLALVPLEIEGKKFTYFKYDFHHKDKIRLSFADSIEHIEVPVALQKEAGIKGQIKVQIYEFGYPPFFFRADITKV